MGTSKISVDLRARSFEIEVPDERVDEVLSRLEALLRLPAAAENAEQQTTETADQAQSGIDDVPEGSGGGDASEANKPDGGRRRGKGPSKLKSYELVDLGLSAEQRQDIRAFYGERAPEGQNDKVAVLGFKLKEYLKRSEFTGDEIHSALKIVDEPTPRNLRAVFGNMKSDGRAGYAGNKIVINSHTEDYVLYHMGKKTKSAK